MWRDVKHTCGRSTCSSSQNFTQNKRGWKTCWLMFTFRSHAVLRFFGDNANVKSVAMSLTSANKIMQMSKDFDSFHYFGMAKCVILIYLFKQFIVLVTLSNSQNMFIICQFHIQNYNFMKSCWAVSSIKVKVHRTILSKQTHTHSTTLSGENEIITRSVKTTKLRAVCLYFVSTSHSTFILYSEPSFAATTIIYGELVTHESIQLKMQFHIDWLE